MENKRGCIIRKIIALFILCFSLLAADMFYGHKDYRFNYNEQEKKIYKLFTSYITESNSKPLLLDPELSGAANAYNRFIVNYGEKYINAKIANQIINTQGVYDFVIPVVVYKKYKVPLEKLLSNKIKGFIKNNSFSNIGISVISLPEKEAIVLLFAKRYLQLESVPLVNYTGQIKISGKLVEKQYNLRVYVLNPEKKVEKYILPDEQKNFEFSYLFKKGTGKYIFQIVGDDNYGTVTLGLFPIYYNCQVESEKELLSYTEASQNIMSRFVAEELLMDSIDNLRRSNGLSPLRYNLILSQAAVEHSTDMAENAFFSQGSYSIQKSVREILNDTELDYSDYSVNIGMGKSMEEIIERMNNWPYYRYNILDNELTDYGVGVAVAAETEGIMNYYVTEYFIRKKQSKFYTAQKEEILRWLNDKRNYRRMAPLLYAPQYAEYAQAHAEEMADLDSLGFVLNDKQNINEKYRSVQGIKKYVVKLFATQQLKNIDFNELYDPIYRKAAIGFAVSDSERFGKNTQWVVMVLLQE